MCDVGRGEDVNGGAWKRDGEMSIAGDMVWGTGRKRGEEEMRTQEVAINHCKTAPHTQR